MNCALTSGRHVGAKAREGADEPFKDKTRLCAAGLRVQQAEGEKAENDIAARLKELGYGV